MSWPLDLGAEKRCKQPRLWCVLEPCLAWESSFALGRPCPRALGRHADLVPHGRASRLRGARPPANGLQRVLHSQLPAFRIVRRPSR